MASTTEPTISKRADGRMDSLGLLHPSEGFSLMRRFVDTVNSFVDKRSYWASPVRLVRVKIHDAGTAGFMQAPAGVTLNRVKSGLRQATVSSHHQSLHFPTGFRAPMLRI
jgi:hypothetical protein